MPVNALRFGNDLEPAIGTPNRFRAAEEEYATLAKSKMEQRDHLGLCLRSQVDEEITAGH